MGFGNFDCDVAVACKDDRGWAMRGGHGRRLRSDHGRESIRGRASFSRSVTNGSSHHFRPEKLRQHKTHLRKRRRQEFASQALQLDHSAKGTKTGVAYLKMTCGTADVKEDESDEKFLCNLTPNVVQHGVSKKVCTAPGARATSSEKKLCISRMTFLCKVLRWKSHIVDQAELRRLSSQMMTKGAPVPQDTPPSHCAMDVTSSRCIVCLESDCETTDVGCGHPLCRSCWLQYTKVKVCEGDWQITCPQPGCTVRVPDATLQKLLSAQLWDKLQNLRDSATVALDPQLCYCPNPQCSKVLRLNTVNSEVATCSCGNSWCPSCRAPAHWPASCSERRVLDTELHASNTESLQLIEKHRTTERDIKQCPNCFLVIEKNGGCSNMVCGLCKMAFCWTCGDVNAPGRSFHASGCKARDWHLEANSRLRIVSELSMESKMCFDKFIYFNSKTSHLEREIQESSHTLSHDRNSIAGLTARPYRMLFGLAHVLQYTWLMLYARHAKVPADLGTVAKILEASFENLAAKVEQAFREGRCTTQGRKKLRTSILRARQVQVPLLRQLRDISSCCGTTKQ